jgi:hypothetical protein
MATDPRNLSVVQRKVLFNAEVMAVFADGSGFDHIRHIAPPPPPSPRPRTRPLVPECNVSLERQLSHGSPCTLDTSFGCASADAMWVDGGCRGTFVCNGIPHVDCESESDTQRTVCDCTPEPPQVWTRPLADGGAAIVFFNAGESRANMSVRFDAIAGRDWNRSTRLSARDLWQHAEMGAQTGAVAAAVEPHASIFLRLSVS